jgi:hypothetical protein
LKIQQPTSNDASRDGALRHMQNEERSPSGGYYKTTSYLYNSRQTFSRINSTYTIKLIITQNSGKDAYYLISIPLQDFDIIKAKSLILCFVQYGDFEKVIKPEKQAKEN